MSLERSSRSTLCAVEIDLNEDLYFTTRQGQRHHLVVTKAWADVHESTLGEAGVAQRGAHTVVRAHINLTLDGVPISLIRWIGSDRSFADPYRLGNLMLWFDANTDIFRFLNEDHGSCRPRKAVRLALWEADQRICPTLLHPWCPLPDDGLRISDCYDSDDCWMGAYHGADAHGGLDINHPAGTTLYTPFAVQRQWLFNAVARGDANNRWRGECDWPDGSTWAIQSHHLIQVMNPEQQPLLAGQAYAHTAGMHNGMYEHSHFVFAVKGPEDEEEIRLDPWLLFRQMLVDRRGMIATRHSGGHLLRSDPPLS